MQLWDTAGQERFRRILTAHFYRDVDAVVLVYDISNRNSFNALKDWINECQVHQLENTPMVLIGNKCDSNRVVTNYEAQQFSDQYKIPVKINFYLIQIIFLIFLVIRNISKIRGRRYCYRFNIFNFGS